MTNTQNIELSRLEILEICALIKQEIERLNIVMDNYDNKADMRILYEAEKKNLEKLLNKLI